MSSLANKSTTGLVVGDHKPVEAVLLVTLCALILLTIFLVAGIIIFFVWSRDSEENNKSNGGEDDMKLSEEEKNELENNAKNYAVQVLESAKTKLSDVVVQDLADRDFNGDKKAVEKQLHDQIIVKAVQKYTQHYLKQKQRKLGIDPETDKQYSELTMKDYESEYAAHVLMGGEGSANHAALEEKGRDHVPVSGEGSANHAAPLEFEEKGRNHVPVSGEGSANHAAPLEFEEKGRAPDRRTSMFTTDGEGESENGHDRRTSMFTTDGEGPPASLEFEEKGFEEHCEIEADPFPAEHEEALHITEESYNEVLLFSKKIESNEQNLLELRKKSRKIDKKISRLGKARSQLADKIDYLLIKLQGEDTEREDHIAHRDDLEGAYREECLANGIAADEIDNNIKKARTSYQPEGELQQMVHDAQMSVKFAQIQMKNTERILERTRKDLGAVDGKLAEREAQKQQLDGEFDETDAKLHELRKKEQELIDKLETAGGASLSDIGAALIGTKRENQLTEMDLKEMKENEDALAEEMSAARARQKENTTQIMSLKAKINEQSEGHEALRAALATAESDYRKEASALGLDADEVDEDIQQAYESLPDDEKLFAIHRAYNEAESSKGQLMRSKCKLLYVENKQDALERQIAMLQERHNQLKEQINLQEGDVTVSSAMDLLERVRKEDGEVKTLHKSFKGVWKDLKEIRKDERELGQKILNAEAQADEQAKKIGSLKAEYREQRGSHRKLIHSRESLEDEFRKSASACLALDKESPPSILSEIQEAHQEVEAAAKIIKTMESSMPEEDKKQSELQTSLLKLYSDKQKIALWLDIKMRARKGICVQIMEKVNNALIWTEIATKNFEKLLAGTPSASQHTQEINELKEYHAKFESVWSELNGYFSQTIDPAPSSPRRVCALVVGIDNYVRMRKLTHAVSDAKAVCKALESKGAKVFYIANCDKDQFDEKAEEFLNFLQEGDAAIVSFAGHGCEYRNTNRLLTLPKKDGSSTKIEQNSVNVLHLLLRIRERKTKINLAILDCCRDFVYGELDPTGAAKDVDRNQRGASGTIMALTGAPKSSESAGDQAHGLFTSRLLKHLTRPNLEISKMLRIVCKEVFQKSAENQEPSINSSSYDNVCLFTNAVPPSPYGNFSFRDLP